VATKRNPVIRTHYQHLLAAGKPKKLALTACMRKLLIILNAMVRSGHLGAIMSVAAANAWLPAGSLPVTVLSNSLGSQNGFPTNFILAIARAVSVQTMPTPPSEAAAVKKP
jgi:hypothetical protein